MVEHKIWLSDDWYISVNEEGYASGPCFEGMLGCVLQIEMKNKETGEISTAALKIPRLLADTIEQNFYISKLTEHEEVEVNSLNSKAGSVEGLVPSQFYLTPPLRKRRSLLRSDYAEARRQDGHVVFVSFQRDKKPRFCAVDLKGETFDIYPEGCRAAFEANVSVDQWRKFDQTDVLGNQPFSTPIFSGKDLNQGAQSGELKGALERGQTTVWYAGLPAIVFLWAGGNLQETITKREIGQWSLEEHFSMFEQLLRGIRFLHKERIIHGDIRPANAMWLGNPAADSYKLGDYGSYGREWELIGAGSSPTGLTMVGPAIGLRRQTPFYSPERRSGKEFESADTAIISEITVENAAGTESVNYAILLGWRSTLMEKGEIKEEVTKLLSEWGASAVASDPADSNHDELQSGDRLRLRNYLFDVIRSERRSLLNQKLFLCSGRYAEILHDSLVVYKPNQLINPEVQPIKTNTILDLSNYVEFQQWSAASDLFSFGAVSLYSLFCGGLQNGGSESGESAFENPDRLFAEMIGRLEDQEWFGFVWDELETFRQTIEDLYNRDPQPSPQEARNSIVIISLDKEQKERTLFETAMHATNSILSSTPRSQILLGAFHSNLAYFLLFMHFALACLHRKSHLPDDKRKSATGFQTPFAEDRVEKPRAEGAAARALERLRTINSYLNQPFFKSFNCTKDEYDKIIKFDPRSDLQIRRELEKTKEEVQRLEGASVDQDKQIRQLHEESNRDEHEINRLKEERLLQDRVIKRLKDDSANQESDVSRLNTQLKTHVDAAAQIKDRWPWQPFALNSTLKDLVNLILNGSKNSGAPKTE